MSGIWRIPTISLENIETVERDLHSADGRRSRLAIMERDHNPLLTEIRLLAAQTGKTYNIPDGFTLGEEYALFTYSCIREAADAGGIVLPQILKDPHVREACARFQADQSSAHAEVFMNNPDFCRNLRTKFKELVKTRGRETMYCAMIPYIITYRAFATAEIISERAAEAELMDRHARN